MNAAKYLGLAGLSTLLLAGLAACDKHGPAETAGKQIDKTVNQAGEKTDAADKVGEQLDAHGNNAGVAIDDAEITAKVKGAIFAEPSLKMLQIGVDTVKGVVTLSGSVGSQANSDKAQSLAGAVMGVARVENKLLLKPSKQY